MPILRSTRPQLDVDINIFHNLYPIGRERWYTVLLLTDDPGPNPGQVTIYGDLSQLADDYPEVSRTYQAAKQFFEQPNVDELWILPVTAQNPAQLPTGLDHAKALNDYIAHNGINFYYLTMMACDELVTAEVADTGSAYEIITLIRNSPGARAMLTVGSGDNEMVVIVRKEGEAGNAYSLEIVKPTEANAPLTVSYSQNANGGYDIVVSLATDADGNIASTVEDVVSALNSDPEISFLVYAYTPDGSGLATELSKTSFEGGGQNPSTLESFKELIESLSSDRVFAVYYDRPVDYYPDIACAALFSTMNPGSFTPKNRIVRGVPPADFTPTEFSQIRDMNANTIFKNPAGLINISDGWATSGLFIDIIMAIDVLAYWQRIALWDLLSQPPVGYNKVPYDNDGFMMIAERLWQTLVRGARPEWNFIVSRNGIPAARIIAPTFEQTDLEDRKNRIYRPRWEATFKGAVHEIVVNGYLTVEFIPPTELRLGTGIEFTYG